MIRVNQSVINYSFVIAKNIGNRSIGGGKIFRLIEKNNLVIS